MGSENGVLTALDNLLNHRGSGEELRAKVMDFLEEYGEARSKGVYRFTSQKKKAGATTGMQLPVSMYYPIDAIGEPMVPGRRYRCDEGALKRLKIVHLGKTLDDTVLEYDDGSMYSSSGQRIDKR